MQITYSDITSIYPLRAILMPLLILNNVFILINLKYELLRLTVKYT
jgi:hypothetical protein